ncbi:MAG: hypothetical protein FWC01_00645 [Treponema sp.]|nr:hypothetical protein [Treponema sp.]MCL2236622.1 hypothetical protein [Treponema sp.]
MKVFLKCIFAIILCFGLAACGLLEFYYLPQVQDIDILSSSLSGVELRLPSMSSISFADGYIIVYKIYISDFTGNSITPSQYHLVNSTLQSDYQNFLSLCNPTTTLTLSDLNTFSSRGFYLLEYDKPTGVTHYLNDNANTFISFHPTDYFNPVIIVNNDPPVSLLRYSGMESYLPANSLFFLNTSELNASYSNEPVRINEDVFIPSSGENLQPRNAFVLMYVIAIGYNYETFASIYSKPTHVGLFMLPARN